MRTKSQISEELKKAEDNVWYDRHQALMEKVYPKELKENPKSESSNCIRRGIKMAKEIEKKYGKKYLSIEDNMEWGLLCGRLETLRWIMGSDWGNLDT